MKREKGNHFKKNQQIACHVTTIPRPIAIFIESCDITGWNDVGRTSNELFVFFRLTEVSLHFAHICEQLFKAKFQAISLVQFSAIIVNNEKESL